MTKRYVLGKADDFEKIFFLDLEAVEAAWFVDDAMFLRLRGGSEMVISNPQPAKLVMDELHAYFANDRQVTIVGE